MATECDLCKWHSKIPTPDCDSFICDKGERVWMGLQGLLRIDTNNDVINYDPCPHLIPKPTQPEPPPTRFQRILQNED